MEGKEEGTDQFNDDDIEKFMKQQTNIEKESCMNVAAFVEEEVKGDEECKFKLMRQSLGSFFEGPKNMQLIKESCLFVIIFQMIKCKVKHQRKKQGGLRRGKEIASYSVIISYLTSELKRIRISETCVPLITIVNHQ